MPNKLVEVTDVLEFLKLPTDHKDAGVVQSLILAAENMLELETGQTFGTIETVEDEIHDGQGTFIVYTDRPISSLTELVIVRPDDDTTIEYNYDVNNDLTWSVGDRRIVSHTAPFPTRKDNILITYVALDNQPEIAKQAIRELVAIVYRRRGSEDARSEHIGSFEHVLLKDVSKETLIYQFAVSMLHIPTLG